MKDYLYELPLGIFVFMFLIWFAKQIEGSTCVFDNCVGADTFVALWTLLWIFLVILIMCVFCALVFKLYLLGSDLKICFEEWYGKN